MRLWLKQFFCKHDWIGVVDFSNNAQRVDRHCSKCKKTERIYRGY